MLSRAASNSRWTSATLAKGLPFKTCFRSGHKKEVASSEVRWIRGWDTITICFSQKLLHAQGCVDGGIVMVQEPIPTLSLLWTFSLQALTQYFQHIQVKLLIYCLSWRNKLPLHYPINIKKRNQHSLDTGANLPPFFSSGRDWRLHWLDCCFESESQP